MTQPAPTAPPPPKTFKEEVIAWVRAIGAALLIWIVLRSYIVEAFRIPSASMENTLLIGDFLFVNKATFGGELEIPVTGITAAVTNAVYHATGIRVRDLPVTTEKLLLT